MIVVAVVACGGTAERSPTAASDGSGLATAPASAAATHGAAISRPPVLKAPAYASRIVVPDLGIDLPVISGDLQPPPNYPFCDVAAYITRFSQPYESGVTYLSAHAQEGMFLPLLEAAQRDEGEELVGVTVDVYTSDAMRYRYAIERIVPHATDYAVVATLPLDERTLVLQTSEGPFGTTEKLQVVATAVDEAAVDPAEANPEAKPRDCRPDASDGTDPAGGSASPGKDRTIEVAKPTPSWRPVPEPSPMPAASAGGGLAPAHVASRVVVEDLGIDLPVISGDLQPPPNYPFCDVAAYVTFLAQPGEPGTTYLTAHARKGMFLPLLEASQRDDGRELLGVTADVYTTDALRYRYEIWLVRRHITDRSIATDGLQDQEQRLVLQTSEGASGTKEKFAVAATLVSIEPADPGFAVPEARPRDCRPDE